MHRFTSKTKREFRALIRPMLERGDHQEDIAEELMRQGFTMPDGKPVHRSTIARHALAMGFRKRNRKRASATPKAPASSEPIRIITDILTVPGLSDQTRLEVIAALTRGKV